MSELPKIETCWVKSIWYSRTIWINTGLFIVSILSLTEVTNFLPKEWSPMVSAVVAVLNVVLRLYTTHAIKLSRESDVSGVSIPPLTDDVYE